MRKYTSCSNQNQSKSLREIKSKRLHNGKKKTLSALYLAEILQQRVWNLGESRGKFREDSGATPLDFKLPVEDRSSCRGPPLAPLDPLLHCRPLTDREARTSLSSTHNTVKREKVVWLLFLWMMSHPDFVCMWMCAWRTHKNERVEGLEKAFPSLSPPSFSIFFPFLILQAE